MSEKRTAVKVGLTAAENEHITRQAQALGMDRSTLMRLRALGDPAVGAGGSSGIPQGPRVYADAVTAAARVSGGLPRVQLEAIVAAVVNALHRSAISK